MKLSATVALFLIVLLNFAARAQEVTTRAVLADSNQTWTSFLRLAGQDVGFVSSVSGGNIHFDTISSGTTPTTKTTGSWIFEPLIVTVPFVPALSQNALMGHLRSALRLESDTNNASLLLIEPSGEQQLLNYSGSWLTGVQFPELNALSSDSGGEIILRFEGGNPLARTAMPTRTRAIAGTSAWYQNGFRLSLGGLEDQQIISVEPLSWTRGVYRDNLSGAYRLSGTADVSNLRIHLSAGAYATWKAYYESIARGSTTQLIDGTLDFISPAGDTFMSVNLYGMGLVSVSLPIPLTNYAASYFVAELFVNRIEVQ